MTDKIENQDVDLQESEEEISETSHGGMKHDPKNAEAQSIAATDKAADATGTAGARKMAGGTAKDNTKKDPMPKTKAGMIAAMVHDMQKMDKKAVNAMYMQKMSTDPEAFDGEPIAEDEEKPTVKTVIIKKIALFIFKKFNRLRNQFYLLQDLRKNCKLGPNL